MTFIDCLWISLLGYCMVAKNLLEIVLWKIKLCEAANRVLYFHCVVVKKLITLLDKRKESKY